MFIKLDDYMKHVIKYFDEYEIMNPDKINVKRVVYLSTDDISVINEAKTKYIIANIYFLILTFKIIDHYYLY